MLDRIAQLRLASRLNRRTLMDTLGPSAFSIPKFAGEMEDGRPKFAGPLTDVSKLRFQAVFMMGAGGSGKGYVSHKWLKYMPGAPSDGEVRDQFAKREKEHLPEMERGLSNLNFEKVLEKIQKEHNIKIDLVDPTKARIPFRVYYYPPGKKEVEVKPEEWPEKLPPAVYEQVKGLTDVVFGTPVHEIPSYWRQVNPDIYKEELAGYLADQPGWVHEMSSEMSKAYFEAAVASGDPIFVDTTGANARKMGGWMDAAKKAGYRVSLVFVYVPLTVNQIRNATRSRKVDPMVVVSQWKTITSNYQPLAGKADKHQVIVNRNDSADIARWKKHGPEIDAFIRKNTHYNNLYELISKEAPKELSDWGRIIAPQDVGGSGPATGFGALDERARSLRSFDVASSTWEVLDLKSKWAAFDHRMAQHHQAATDWKVAFPTHAVREAIEKVYKSLGDGKSRTPKQMPAEAVSKLQSISDKLSKYLDKLKSADDAPAKHVSATEKALKSLKKAISSKDTGDLVSASAQVKAAENALY